MKAGILLLGAAYVLSQFFRAFLAVLTPILGADIGASADDLARASGLWFLAFAAMQIPVGWALDTLGPRRTAGWILLGGGGGGAAIFALATAPWHIDVAMTLIGVGCSPVLMASFYIFGREYPPARFAVLASLMLAIGSSGNLVAAYPMALAAELVGWRASLWALASLSTLVALGIFAFVRDPAPVEGEESGSLLALFRVRALWLIYPLIGVSYAISIAVRGLWIGPYLSDTFAATVSQIGTASLVMGIGMVVGALAYAQADRMLPSRKWMIVGGSVLILGFGGVLITAPTRSLLLSATMMAATGFFGANYAVLMAHGRSFLPPALIGRGVTMLNLFSIGGVGVLQVLSGRVYRSALANGAAPTEAYVAVFTLFVASLALGLAFYLFSRDSPAD
ncbi:MFS transporter [uncultured Sulfitobacter sp.]|uniref:MFS transporter n=1 Tax=uncultured Sulfitobacter sp. TaxID=191468 RepID=UPI002635645B|nr:MFS transporter [uncultured Sulfitobacter sp.]